VGASEDPGRRGEDAACRYLESRGFRILARNYRCRLGEIDIVAREGDVTVFVEVKQRSDVSHGGGFEAVTPAKRLRVVRAARLFAASKGLSESPLRFDVISLGPDGRVRHDRGAFDAEGR